MFIFNPQAHCMINDLKGELIHTIQTTSNENLLLLLKADCDYFIKDSKEDVLDELSEENRKELTDMLNEPFGQDTLSQQEFDEAIRQWRTK